MSLPTSLYSLLLVLSASVPLATAAPSLTDDASCDCYRTNGSIVDFFSDHRFFDFRNLEKFQGVPKPIKDKEASAAAYATSDYFLTDEWNAFWATQSWNNSGGAREDATVFMGNTPNNVYIEKNSDTKPSSKTFLTLRTTRLPTFQSAAEIESVSKDFQYLSMRMLARTMGASGACTAMFTYRGKGENVQEADIEVMTNGPKNKIQYTNQPTVNAAGDIIENASVNATLPGGLEWTDWAVHRLDWTPTQSTWYVDGVESAKLTFQVPRDPSQVILNSWSDGGNWTGKMAVNESAYMQIQWFEIVYNGTAAPANSKREDDDSEGCDNVCSIDDTPSTGTPVMLWSGAQRGFQSSGLAGWIPYGVALTMVYMSADLFW